MLAPVQSDLVTEHRPLAALSDMTAAWHSLAERAAEPNIFYDPAFALAAASVLGRDAGAVLVWSAGVPRRLLGLFPFTIAPRRYLIRLPVLVGWTHPFAPLGTPLIDRDAGAAVAAAFLNHVLGDEMLPKLVLLPLLNAGGPVAAMLAAALERRGGAYRAFDRHRRALLRPGRDRAGYIERAISPKRRKELRRQRHRLAEAGALQFELATTADAVAAALEDFIALEASGWKGRAGTAMAQQPDIKRFVETAVTTLAERGQVRIARLRRHDRLIASAVTLTSGNAAWSWKTAYDEGVARASPEVQLFMDLTAALLADEAIAVVNSCAVPDHPMIDHLWVERLDLADWLVAPRRDATFDLACRLETMRRQAVATARLARDRIRGGLALKTHALRSMRNGLRDDNDTGA